MKIYLELSIKSNSFVSKVNQPEPLTTGSMYAEQATKSFSGPESMTPDDAVFTESICKKAESENLSLEQLQQTLRNIQVIIMLEFKTENTILKYLFRRSLGKQTK